MQWATQPEGIQAFFVNSSERTSFTFGSAWPYEFRPSRCQHFTLCESNCFRNILWWMGWGVPWLYWSSSDTSIQAVCSCWMWKIITCSTGSLAGGNMFAGKLAGFLPVIWLVSVNVQLTLERGQRLIWVTWHLESAPCKCRLSVQWPKKMGDNYSSSALINWIPLWFI